MIVVGGLGGLSWTLLTRDDTNDATEGNEWRIVSPRRKGEMPYKSEKQRKWAHTLAGTKSLGGKNKVQEWDKASKGKKLPKKAKKGRKK